MRSELERNRDAALTELDQFRNKHDRIKLDLAEAHKKVSWPRFEYLYASRPFVHCKLYYQSSLCKILTTFIVYNL